MLSFEDIDGVRVITMDHGENRFGPTFVPALEAAVEDAASTGGPLVLTGTGKFFCNGLDLDAFDGAERDVVRGVFDGVHRILTALCRHPGLTVAAINGHAFGGGAIMSGACDLRVMRADRGFFCFPEAHLGMTMSPQFDAVIEDGFPAGALRRALLTGHRYGGVDAAAAGLVDLAVEGEDAVVPAALDMARPHVGLDGPTVAGLRAPRVARSLAALAVPRD